MTPHLTDDEIASITEPLTQGAARCKYLERLGLKVEPRPNGQPLVGRAHFEEVMRGRPGEAANDSRTGKVNFAGLRDKVRCGRGAKT